MMTMDVRMIILEISPSVQIKRDREGIQSMKRTFDTLVSKLDRRTMLGTWSDILVFNKSFGMWHTL